MKKRFLRGKASLMIFVLVFALFSVYLMNPVSAQDKVCCEKTKSGQYCLYTESSNCDTSVRSENLAVTCEQASYCELGCCQNNVDGSCFKSTSLATCTASGSKFFADENCGNSECKLGCCVLSGECSYTTDKGCDSLVQEVSNITKDFREVASELACSDICRGTDQGCCQNSDGACVFTSRESCSETFNDNKLCSDIASCKCTSHYAKGCYDDDVYWLDSCGNREGKFADCDYASGTICGKNNAGGYVCKSVNCADTYTDEKNVHDEDLGGLRKNGESWCIYESGTGDYLDRPGTRHFRHMCVNGEEMVESCRDYREEICIQGKIQSYTEAQCIMNDIYDSSVGTNISTVPVGFQFWKDDGNCASADKTCEVVYVKSSRFASWKCEQNCQCETSKYIDDMNKWCKAQGDCGANLNILGVRSSAGFTVSGDDPNAPRNITEKAWENYSVYGVFGGMKLLSEQFEKIGEATAKEASGLFGLSPGLGAALVAGAVAAVAFTGVALATGITIAAKDAVLGLCTIGMCVHPIGIIIVVVVMIVVFVIFGGSETKTYYVVTKCSPWQAPDGGDDCGKCRNDNKLDILSFDDCTEYKCKSLGKLCDFIPDNEGSDRVSCYNQNPNDVNSPVISPWPEALTAGYSIKNLDYGFSITPKVKPFTLISFGIKTDELSQCKISEEHTGSFDEMADYFGDSYFTMEHNITLNLANGKDYNYYVRCKDPTGNANAREYLIQVSIDKGPDLTPPVIEGFDPEDGSYISANLTEATVNINLNEPSTCKWSSADKDYDSMEETASCDLTVHTSLILEYDCYARFNITKGVNTVYFRCMDLAGNKNIESTPYSLIGSDQLAIIYSAPSGTLYDTNSPTLEVATASGSNSGAATCAFSTSDVEFDRMITFFTTGSANHKQNLLNLPKGDYAYYVKCRDSASNEASALISFRIDADVSAPEIVYIYSEGSTLYLVLNEPSTCEYSYSTFTYGNGELMSGSGTSQQTLPVDQLPYYINCADNYNNTMSEIIVYS